jgi:hypothetical protein
MSLVAQSGHCGRDDECPLSGGTTNIARLGNIVEKIGTSQRILPQAVQQRFEVSSSGALVPPTEGSTKPVKS